MAKTVLQYVQEILSDMDTDPVNSWDETVESEQVGVMLKSAYEALMSNRNWPHQKKAIQITPSGQVSLPTHMNLQEGVKELNFINYNKARLGETRKRYEPVKYRSEDDFLRLINTRDNDSDTVDIITDPTGVELLISNNVAPSYYTSFDDSTLVFDSYDSSVDSTLQQAKVQAQAYVMGSFQLDDDHIPDIPREAETALLEETKSRAMFRLKQVQDIKSEGEARRQQSWLSRKAWKVNGGVKYPNYGRRGKK